MEKLVLASVLLFAVLCSEAAPRKQTSDLHRRKHVNVTRPLDGAFGIDVSSPWDEGTMSCLVQNGYSFAIVRAYESVGQPDPNAPQTVANAWAAGFSYVDVYLFPCPQCQDTLSATDQVNQMIQSLSGTDYGQIWLDVEGADDYWLGDYSANQAFFEELLSAASSYKPTGVYASAYQWSSIMGDDYTGGSGNQLWYAHYDDDPAFDDFSSFGGWGYPNMKQYYGDASVCGADVDLNWYP